jgi:thiamine-monophosphate kinase
VHAALRAVGLDATRIGRVVPGEGVHAKHADGSPWHVPRSGHEHFA